MALCEDPRLTYLNNLGYNVVRLPRRGILPLGVIGREDGSRNWLGTLDQIWKSPVPTPVAGPPQAVPGIAGESSSDLKLSVGLDILANALNGIFGGTAPNISPEYANARWVKFVFRDVQSVSIDPFVIGNYLAQGSLMNKDNAFVNNYLTGKAGVETIVITEILQSKSIGVVAKKDASTGVAVNVPAIQAALGVKAKVSVASQDASEVTYEGADFLTFGFKAFGIRRVQEKWQVYGIRPSGAMAFSVGKSHDEPLVTDGELLDLDFPAAS